MKNLRKQREGKTTVHLGNEDKAQVEIGLLIEHILVLKNIIYVSSIRRNLILAVVLDFVKYSCYFGNKSLIYKSNVVGIGILSYEIELNPNFVKSINIVIGKKRNRIKESPLML